MMTADAWLHQNQWNSQTHVAHCERKTRLEVEGGKWEESGSHRQ
jgi:hypothetical protein